MTIIAQQQSKLSGRWFRCRRIQTDCYVIERAETTSPDATWDEQTSWYAPREKFVVAEMRRMARLDAR
jgi:hypothetical protein